MSLVLRIIFFICICSTITVTAEASQSTPLRFSLTTSPGLTPSYQQSIPDYTTTCADGTITITAAIPQGYTLQLNGKKYSRQTLVRTVAMQPGEAVRFRVGNKTRFTKHLLRCRPADMTAWTTTRTGKPTSQWWVWNPTLFAGGSPYTIITDNYGVPVWWLRSTDGNPGDAKILRDKTVLWSQVSSTSGAPVHRHYTLNGKKLSDVNTVNGNADAHDAILLPNGNWLLELNPSRAHVDLTAIGGPADTTVFDAEIQEVTPKGKLVWDWKSQDHISPSETTAWVNLAPIPSASGTAYDLVHLNSLEDDGDGIVFSARHLDAVYRISKKTGRIDWKLGGSHRAESLRFVNDPIGNLSGQHDARILSDGTLTVHDNGVGDNRPPRAVHYRINKKRKTATLLDSVQQPGIQSSFCCGSARRLPDGHWVTSWGANNSMAELSATGKPILQLSFVQNVFSYRVQPLLPGVLSRSELQQGMDAISAR